MRATAGFFPMVIDFSRLFGAISESKARIRREICSERRCSVLVRGGCRLVAAAPTDVRKTLVATTARRLGALFLLALFLAADAQRGDRASDETAEADLFVAI